MPTPPSLRRPELLLCDAGNTLVFLDFEEIAAVVRREGADADPRRLEAAEGAAKRRYEALLAHGGVGHERGWMVYVETLLVEGGVAPGAAPALTAALRAHHDRRNLWRRVPEGLPAALARARGAGIRLGVVSNAEGTVEALLHEVGLGPHLEHVIDSHAVGVSKPDPRIFAVALERFGVAPSRATYAGDIPEVDVDGARAAGLDAVLIDARGLYAGYVDAPVFPSVAALIDALLG